MIYFASNRFRRVGACLVLVAMAACGPAVAVAERFSASEDTEQREPGLRFTPGMARAFGGIYVRQVLKRRYELPDEKVEQAQELVARRFMQMAHKIDEPGGELLERFIEEQLDHQASGGGGRFMPPAFGKEFAERILPIIPEINEMVRGVSQDVRPMLPMKQQLKMAGDMMAFKTGVDGFEATMKKWSSGEVTDYQDPFRSNREIKRDETGQSERLKGARTTARNEIERPRAKRWEGYVVKFKELYALDAAQSATADSILREYTQREERLLADEAWRDRTYQGRLWTAMAWELESAWSHPARTLIEDYVNDNQSTLEELEEGFKTRLETVPTTGQRRAAEQKVADLLKEKGLQLPEVNP